MRIILIYINILLVIVNDVALYQYQDQNPTMSSVDGECEADDETCKEFYFDTNSFDDLQQNVAEFVKKQLLEPNQAVNIKTTISTGDVTCDDVTTPTNTLNDVTTLNGLQEQPKVCHRTKYKFPNRYETRDYIIVKTPLPDISDLTLCVRLSPTKELIGSLLSYYTTLNGGNTLYIFLQNNGLWVYITHEAGIKFQVRITSKTHICVVISKRETFVKLYIDGKLVATEELRSNTIIPGNGSMVVGQDQDSELGGFSSHQAFTGIIENMLIWSRILTDEEISELYENDCLCANDYVISLHTDEVEVKGEVEATYASC